MSIIPFPDYSPGLPAPLTPLVGREREVAAVRGLLEQAGVRLVTLTGPGGVGKTRLAQQVATELAGGFPDGAWFVSLAPLRDPSLVVPTIAQRLGLQESGERPVEEALVAYLAPRRLLLVLDNFEHLTEAAAALPGLLASSPGLVLLVTSRTGLHLVLTGEHEFPVPPLSLPDQWQRSPPAELARVDAVALFVQRAIAVRSDFTLTETNAPAVAEVCRRLDGLPLAIELAAARTKILSPAALLARISNRLQLLTSAERGIPERHRTLRDTIAWSNDLLAPVEQALFRSLAVFAGGFTLEAAEAVGGRRGDERGESVVLPSSPSVLDGLTMLVDENLLQLVVRSGDEPRFEMLETVREFASERLAASGTEGEVRRRHAAYFLTLAERADPALMVGPEQADWLERLTIECDNLRAAMTWALDNDGDVALRLAGILARFWASGLLSEGRTWLEQALARRSGVPIVVVARALTGASNLAMLQGDHAGALALAEEALALYRQTEDEPGTGLALLLAAITNADLGNLDRAVAANEEALTIYRRIGDTWGVATVLNNLAPLAKDRGDLERAAAFLEEALSTYRQLDDRRGIAVALANLSVLARLRADAAGAVTLARESLANACQLGDRSAIAIALWNLAGAIGFAERPTAAARIFGAAEAQREEVGVAISPFDLPGYECDVAALGEVLGPADFAAAWAAGRTLTLDEAIAEALADEPDPVPPPVAAVASPTGIRLSRREHEVLRLLVEGKTDREIGQALFVSRRTAAAHVASILAKLGVSSRTAAVAAAIRAGLVSVDER